MTAQDVFSRMMKDKMVRLTSEGKEYWSSAIEYRKGKANNPLYTTWFYILSVSQCDCQICSQSHLILDGVKFEHLTF